MCYLQFERISDNVCFCTKPKRETSLFEGDMYRFERLHSVAPLTNISVKKTFFASNHTSFNHIIWSRLNTQNITLSITTLFAPSMHYVQNAYIDAIVARTYQKNDVIIMEYIQEHQRAGIIVISSSVFETLSNRYRSVHRHCSPRPRGLFSKVLQWRAG